MRALALGLRAPYRLKRTIALLAQATLSLNFTKGGPLDSRVTFSRASGGTSFRPVSYGPELIASQDLTTWVSGGAFGNWPGTTTTSSTITTTGANGARRVRMACTPDTVYRMSGTVTGGTGPGSVAIAFGTSAGVYITHKDEAFVASGVASSVLLAPSNAAFVEFAVRGGNTGQTTSFASISASAVLLDRPGDPIQLFTAPANVPRFDYDPVSRRCNGLLIEEQRTNLLLWSRNFANAAWTKMGCTVSVSSVLAPDGSPMTLLTENTTTGAHYVLQSAVSGTGRATQSWYVKPNGRTRIQVRSESPQTNQLAASFLLTGNGSVTAGAGTISLLADGIYYVTVASTANGSGASGYHLIQTLDATGAESYAGDNTSGIYIWGAQLEAGAFATSHIPTTGAAATRAQDIAYIATAGWLNTTVGTMLLDFNQLLPPSQQDVNAVYFAAYPNSSLTNGQDAGYAVCAAHNYLTRNPVSAAPSLGGFQGASRIALAVDGTGKYAVRNGGSVLSLIGTGFNDSGAPTVFSLCGGSGARRAQHVRRVAYWPRRMSNLDLIGLTR